MPIQDGIKVVGRLHTVHEIYATPRWGEKVALQYAEDLPAVPLWPFK